MKTTSHRQSPSDPSDLPSHLAQENFASLGHYDSRLVRRTIRVAESLFSNPGARFSQAFKTPAERKAAYRLIENTSLAPEDLIDSIGRATAARIEDLGMKVVLVPHDTSTISDEFPSRIEGMGCIGPKESSGFFFHTSLALSLEGVPHGLLGLKLFTRPEGVKKSREEWKKHPIEEKESFRWVEVPREVRGKLPAEVRAIFISDRESDIHEYFQEFQDTNDGFVVRHSHNRRTVDSNGEVAAVRTRLAASPIRGNASIQIPKAGARKARTAHITVQWERITFHLRPGGLAIHKNRKPVTVMALRVYETEPPTGVESIEWILYTNLPVDTIDQALETVRIYTCRWRIEEFHSTLKTGMRIEDNRLQKAENIQRLLAISAPMAVKLLEMTYRSRKDPNQPASTAFSECEIRAIKVIAKMQTGRTPKHMSIQQAVNHIAFLGGWMGRKGDGPPGVRTLWEGWRQVAFLVAAMTAQSHEPGKGVRPCG